MIPPRCSPTLAEAKAPTQARHISQTLDEIIARRVSFLTAYQNAAYAERYRHLVARVQRQEAAIAAGPARG